MEEEQTPCGIGLLTQTTDDCYLLSYSNKKILYNINTFATEEILILRYRVDEYFSSDNDTICNHHKSKYLDYFDKDKVCCCDPFQKHKKFITSSLRSLTLKFCCDTLKNIVIKLKPGEKICRFCELDLKKLVYPEDSLQKNNELDEDIGASISQHQPENRKRCSRGEQMLTTKISCLSGMTESSSGDTDGSSSLFTTRSNDWSTVEDVVDLLGVPAIKCQKRNWKKNQLN